MKEKSKQGFPNFLDYRIFFKEHLAQWIFQWLHFGKHQIMDLKIFIKQRLNCNYKRTAIWNIEGHPQTQRWCSLNVNRKGFQSVFIMSTVSSLASDLAGHTASLQLGTELCHLGVHFLDRHSQLLAKAPPFLHLWHLGKMNHMISVGPHSSSKYAHS